MKIRIKLPLLLIVIAGADILLIISNKPLRIFSSERLITAILLVSAIIIYGYTTRLVKRIGRISSKLDLIGRGEYYLEISDLPKDELGSLEEKLDKLASYNQGLIRKKQDEDFTLQTILSGIQEGVIILNCFGRITFINSAIERMFERDLKSLEGKFLMNLIRDKELDQVVTKIVLDTIKQENIEIQSKGNIYSIWISGLPGENMNIGVVLVIRNVTELRRLERMRTEFVANVSHELRTPLTSIKGFIETLLDGAAEDKETRERFLRVIYNESLRLQAIIDDLLTLSRIENKPLGIKREIAKFCFIQNAFLKIRPVIESYAEAKGLKINVLIPDDLPNVRIGEDLLSQVLLNLMENAVKYTAKGQISLLCSSREDFVIVEVKDTGCGIPEGDIARIFERFYRVDRARSREMGGTGLGLSIVKHIVEDSGGRITVASEVGKGSTFTCFLPRV